MSYQDEMSSLYEFLQHTAQGNLKKMFVDQKFTDVHLNLLMKITKNCTLEQFTECLEKDQIPKIKLSNAEAKIREGFWGICRGVFKSRGLLTSNPPATTTAPAASTPKAA